MTIIVFLIDTSASMNQRAYLGGRPKLLDIAKGAVETFVKVSCAVTGTLYLFIDDIDIVLRFEFASLELFQEIVFLNFWLQFSILSIIYDWII